MATVTMGNDAVLTEQAASQAIGDAGFEVVSFEAGEPRKVTAPTELKAGSSPP